ncbi:MAG: phytanoyl-CoA dioxygenase family protein [Cyanobacteria bacterium J083]|nr:MAG: phytanoyl-CoA dioxygenase family protein [Cyanobacteria bacterium J083]
MNPQEYYRDNGYFVYRNLLPHDAIDNLLDLYNQKIIPAKYPFFRQDTNKYEPNQINKFGYVKQAFLDIHDYRDFPEFSTKAKDIFCSKLLQQALSQITGFTSFNLMQTMLFDANTATSPHQDWWYLDSISNGHLIAAWIALEDIKAKAGRFYVIPKTIKVDLHSHMPNLPWLEWKKLMQQYFDEHRSDVYAPALNKGDVLFWNSRTIHGALPTQDPSFSRKSLTAHYLPSNLKFGNLFTTKDYIKYKTYKGVNYYKNQPDYSPLNKLKSQIKVAVYSKPRLLKAMRFIKTSFTT